MDDFDKRLDSYFSSLNDIVSSDEEIPIERVIEFTSKKINTELKSSYEYTGVNIKSYSTKKIDSELRKNLKYNTIINYISLLFDYQLTGKTYNIDNNVLDEATEWDLKGLNCVYFSVLLYFLLKVQCSVCEDCLHIVQGFYRHEIRKDYPEFLPWAGQHNGFHTWVTIGGSVVDIAIRQQSYFFDFGDYPFVIGDIPEGLTYMGWEENYETALRYLMDIIEYSNKNIEEWIFMHIKNSYKAFENTLMKLKKIISEDENEDKCK